MRQKVLLFAFSILSLNLLCQEINGIVYDADDVVKGVKVLNISKKILTTTNDSGEFRLRADLNDSISFQSVFYKPIIIVVKDDYFEGTYVFELQKIINELEAVNIANKPKPLVFAEDKYNQSLDEIITKDKEDRGVSVNGAPKYGLDFIQVAKLIGRLFKNKKKNVPNTLKYDQLKLLFEKNPFFTKTLLIEELKVPEQYHSLFYEFCETKSIPESKLDYNNRLPLLNDFTLYASEFMVFVEMAEEQAKESKKDKN